jgi:glycosyltransferase involved in cell wall biosynthesis
MRILALEPYYGGSHQAFLDGWVTRSRHSWTVLHLPPHNWKWRMRHSALSFNRMVRSLIAGGGEWDFLFCTDMLGLAEFLGLAPRSLGELPSLVYFHENQLTYPVEECKDRDYHFAFTNMTTALAANRAWFNSRFHMDSFLDELRNLLGRMPDHQPLADVESIRAKSAVRYPGIEAFPNRGDRQPGPARILWAARWEDEKGPADFFSALEVLEQNGIDFRLSVIGGGDARHIPGVFEVAKLRFDGRIDHWGFQESRDDYRAVLSRADIAVSTAYHEFFGIGMAEAIAAGAFPLVPNRLAYPEVLKTAFGDDMDGFFYDGTADGLAEDLTILVKRVDDGSLWKEVSSSQSVMDRFSWDAIVPEWDDELELI